MARTRKHKINTPSARRELAPRREPYWHQIRERGYLGYRKSEDGGTWIARWHKGEGKQEYRSLGALAEYEAKEQFDRASELANAWFQDKSGPQAATGRLTFPQACKNYTSHLSAEKGARAVADAKMRIKAKISATFDKYYVDEITTGAINAWRNSYVPEGGDEEQIRRAKDTANRYLSTLKAILNQAFNDQKVSSDRGWRTVTRFKDVGKAREVFLTDKQISRLLEASTGAFKDLVTGLLLTGMRTGIEIEYLVREQFHGEMLEIRRSKTGRRLVHLSKEAQAFFRQQAQGKLPTALLFPRDDGRPWASKQAERTMQEVRKTAKLPEGAVLYSLRHTYISRALEHGASAKLIADNCGTSLRMVEKHYWKALQKHRQEMLDQVPMLPAVGDGETR
jgi:integrase